MKGIMLGYGNSKEMEAAIKIGMPVPEPVCVEIGNIYFNHETVECMCKDEDGNITLQISGILHVVKFDKTLWDAMKKHLQKNII